MPTHNILGTGLTGSVFLQISQSSHNLVATKKATYGNEKELQTEVAALRRVAHQNIIKLISSRPDDNEFDLEYCVNGSLALHTATTGLLSAEAAQKMLFQVAQALAYLQSVQICHHDIKPENICLDENLTPKLVDFAFAVDYSATPDHLIRFYGGTTLYSALEVLERIPHTAACDIFSFGVVFFRSIFGTYPFGAASQSLLNLKENIRANRLQFPNSGVSESLKDLLQKLLCPFRRKRIAIADVLKHPFWSQKE